MQQGVAIGIERPLAVTLTIFGDAEAKPPAALIRLLTQQLHIERRRIGILAQLLSQPGPGGVVVHVAGEIRLITGQPAKRLLLLPLADGKAGQ